MDINKNVSNVPDEGYNVSYPEQCGYLYCDNKPECKGYSVSQDRIMVEDEDEPKYKCFPKATLDRRYINSGDNYDENTVNNPGNFPRSVTKMGVSSYIKKRSGWASLLDQNTKGNYFNKLMEADNSPDASSVQKLSSVQDLCNRAGFQ